nr:unnamed protein product [Spirometra erinaceieuropaei]
MQDVWAVRKAEEIQGYADRNEWKNFFSAIKTVYSPPTKVTAALLSSDGRTLLTEKTQIPQRWTEHFRGVLNRPSTISYAEIARPPQVETNVDLDLPSSLHEAIRVVQQLCSGKAPGSDAIPAEIYKYGDPQLMDHLTSLFQEMWHQGEVLQDFKDATIVHIYKRNEQSLPPEIQCGFCRNRGTTDMIFAARQLQEKCQEMRVHLHSTFVDLTNALDTVNREELWKIMQKFGCPGRFTQMVHLLHDGIMARITDNGAVSEALALPKGAKQGRVLLPTLFNLMFSAMLIDLFRDERPEIRIAYRTESHLLNQRRMDFQSRVSTTTIHQLRPQHHLGGGHAKKHSPLLRRLRELRSGRQHGEDYGRALTATQHSLSLQCATDQRERNATESGEQLLELGQYPLPQHEHRRRRRPQDFEAQSSIRPPPKHTLESPWSPTEHEAEDVQGRHPADAAVRSEDLDGVHEAGTPTEPLSPQFSSPYSEAELAWSNPRDRCIETDQNS